MWNPLSATLSKVLRGSIPNLFDIPNLVKEHNCCPHSEVLVCVPSYQLRVHKFSIVRVSCLCGYPNHVHGTRTYPGCMNWLAGVHSLWWDILLIFNIGWKGLGSASTLYGRFCWLPKWGPTLSIEWMEGWNGAEVWKKGKRGNSSWYVKWKQKHLKKVKPISYSSNMLSILCKHKVLLLLLSFVVMSITNNSLERCTQLFLKTKDH